MRGSRFVATAAAVTLMLVASGCSGDDDGTGSAGTAAPPERRLPADVTLASSLRRFDNCDDIRTWAKDELAPRVGAYGWPGGGYWFGGGDVLASRGVAMESTVDFDAAAGAPVPATGGDDGGQSFSETNTQVEGVDEPDSIKTDGNIIVAVAEGKLQLIDAKSQRVLDSIALPDELYDAQILLAGNRVLSFGYASFGPRILVDDAIGLPSPEIPGTRVVQYDIDGETLKQSDSYVIDGSYVSARMVGDVVRLVLQADPGMRLGFVAPAVPTPEAQERATQLNRQVIEEADAGDFLPKWRKLDDKGEIAEEGDLMACADAHAPNTFSGFGMVTVLSVDLSDGLADGITSTNGTGVMASGQTVYANADHLYVAAPEWQDWQALEGDELRAAEAQHGTDIHRFDISDANEANYEMSGHVDGDVLNQFAMDEHDGNLRVATTTGNSWSEGADESESHVIVLAPGDGKLNEIGKVSGLGKGETIQSVRFLGDTGYVVTFEQTDPLYTIDLSNPQSPRVAGELKVLGFSSYLHPIGDGFLVGIGQDATEEGTTTGAQVALFDVRDPAAPTRVAQATLPNGFTNTQWDHHAFLYWAETGLVAIPVDIYDGTTQFSGVVGFTVDSDPASVTELGRIQHPAVSEATGEPVPLPIEPDGGIGSSEIDIAPDEFAYTPPITRTMVIGDKVWTLSDTGIGSSDLATLGQTSFIPFS